jgi:DNA primase
LKLSQHTINEIQSRIDIEEIISDFVTLKRKGQNLWACCPFHHEKSPSFSVSPAKGIYKCFGCGKAGDSVQFVMDVEGLNFLEAMRYLANKYGIEIEEEVVSDEALLQHNEKESLYIALNFAKDYFKDILHNHPDGQAIGLSYFRERGFTEKVIKDFDLGFSLDLWDGFYKAALSKGFKEEILEKAGLIIKKENKTYDRFRNRVIFPIHSVTGKAIAFGARILKTEKNQPKYINSPETEVYHKSQILYGIFQARQAIRQEDNCFLVEGYTDVISLHLSDIPNVVASSGTSLTVDQIKLISRYTENITVLYDGDSAGIKASFRGIDMILEGGLNVKAVVFPDGEDPDSYSRKLGTTAFQKYLKDNAKDFLTFKTSLFAEESAKDPIKKAEVIKEIVVSISKIPDPLKRSIYLKQCSQLLDIDESVLITELNKVQIRKSKEKEKERDQPPPPDFPDYLEEIQPELLEKKMDPIAFQEKESIRILLNYGLSKIEENFHLHDYLLNEIKDIEFSTPVYRDILNIYRENLGHGKIINADYLIKNSDENIKNEVISLITPRYEVSENWEKLQIYIPREEDLLTNLVITNILRLKLKVVQKIIAQNMHDLKISKDDTDIIERQKIHMELMKVVKEISSKLGIVVGR